MSVCWWWTPLCLWWSFLILVQSKGNWLWKIITLKIVYFRKTLKASFKCRPTGLRTKISCEGESLSIACKPSQRIAIASSKFSSNPSSLLYCPMTHPKQEDHPCDDLVITSKISRLCHGQNKCSVLADPVVLAIMGSGTIIKQSLLCHKNNSALRTTSANTLWTIST